MHRKKTSGWRRGLCQRLVDLLQAVHSPVQLPLWVCLLFLGLLLLLHVQVRQLGDSLAPSSRHNEEEDLGNKEAELWLHHLRGVRAAEWAGRDGGGVGVGGGDVEGEEEKRDGGGYAGDGGGGGGGGDGGDGGGVGGGGGYPRDAGGAGEGDPARLEEGDALYSNLDEGDDVINDLAGDPARNGEAGDDLGHAAGSPLQTVSATGRAVVSDSEVAALTQVLQQRLARASTDNVIGLRNCSTLAAMNNVRGTCVDPTCPRDFPASLETRVRQLLVPALTLTDTQKQQIAEIGQSVPQRKYIFVTAASSNHFNESQALVYNLRKFVFPKLVPGSYSFYYFNLGMKDWERRLVVKNCNCTVMDLHLKAFPVHVRKLMCYAWKPLIIAGLLPKAEVLVYMDVSIRFRNMDMDAFFNEARQWGARFLNSMDSIPNHTVQSMFDFYGDLPCMFWPYPELLAGFSVLHNEPFVKRLLLEPWVSCALNGGCMCPVDGHAYRICPHTERRVGQCHRFDLSSMTLQVAKLFGHHFGQLVMQSHSRPRIRRGESMAFFTE